MLREELAALLWPNAGQAEAQNNLRVNLTDRLKDMIISGGFNVYAIEVEAALASHPAVLMSAIVGVRHEEWGEAVHGEVVLRQGASAPKTS